MSFTSVDSALYVHVVWVRRNACAFLVFRGEAQTNKDCYCFDCAFHILPMMHLNLVILETDLEVKVAAVSVRRRQLSRSGA